MKLLLTTPDISSRHQTKVMVSTLFLAALRPATRTAAFSLSSRSVASSTVRPTIPSTLQRIVAPHRAEYNRLFSTTEDVATNNEKNELEEVTFVEEQIVAKGNQIRTLKDDGISKQDLAPHVEELLALKARLANLTGQAPATAVSPKQEKKENTPKKKGAAIAPPKKDESEMSINELRDSRLGKAAAMREMGVEPYAYVYDPNRTAAQLSSEYDGKLEPGEEDATNEYTALGEGEEIAVAGRIMARRVFGKLAFYTLQDETGIIQLQFDKNRLCERDADSFKNLKAWTDSGDIIGARGTIRRTDKGELTLYAKEWTMLTKSALPLPDKYHGLTDISKRYRNRHLDLIVNPSVRETFYKRAKITSSLRRQLDEKGFLEIETPVLHTQPGGAEAKPFETYHNTMDMELTLRIATELHLKRLIIGGFPRVYEVGRIFRNEGISTRHNPEFTSVELYQAYADYGDMMDLTEELICGE